MGGRFVQHPGGRRTVINKHDPKVSTAIFIMRRYASTVYAVIMCMCVSVCLTYSSIISKRLNVESCQQSHTIAQGL